MVGRSSPSSQMGFLFSQIFQEGKGANFSSARVSFHFRPLSPLLWISQVEEVREKNTFSFLIHQRVAVHLFLHSFYIKWTVSTTKYVESIIRWLAYRSKPAVNYPLFLKKRERVELVWIVFSSWQHLNSSAVTGEEEKMDHSAAVRKKLVFIFKQRYFQQEELQKVVGGPVEWNHQQPQKSQTKQTISTLYKCCYSWSSAIPYSNSMKV